MFSNLCLVGPDGLFQRTYGSRRKKDCKKIKRPDRTYMAPFGFMDDGLDDTSFVDKEGDRWFTDVYGDMGHTCGNIGNGFRWTVQVRTSPFTR